MSYNDFNEELRQQAYERQQSHKIGIALWPEQISPQISDLPRSCPMCARVLTPYRQDPDKFLFCGDCGSTFPINEPVATTTKKHKTRQKQNAKPSLVLISQQNKRKKRRGLSQVSDIDEETRADLRLLGMIDDSNLQEG